jgi:hypothetical protein
VKALAWLLTLAACGDNRARVAPDATLPPDALACGSSTPTPACVAHGLAGVDLTGTWAFSGTLTSTNTRAGNPPTVTTSPATDTFSFAAAGCSFTWQDHLITAAWLDDTNAAAQYAYNDEHGEVRICAAGDGTIVFDEDLYYDRSARNGGQGDDDWNGTLTRQ